MTEYECPACGTILPLIDDWGPVPDAWTKVAVHLAEHAVFELLEAKSG